MQAKGKFKIDAMAVIIVLAVAVLLFINRTGDIKVSFGDTNMRVHCQFRKDLSIPYEDIVSSELREGMEFGSRENAFASRRLLMGYFKSEEFGEYILYTYAQKDAQIVMHMKNGTVIALGGEDKAQTVELYNTLLEKTTADPA